jgi:lysine/ornithine N-monooxygenase
VGENVYEMTLSRNKGKEVKTVKVKPVFKGEGYNKAMEKYNALMEQYNKAAEDRAKKEADFKAKAKK